MKTLLKGTALVALLYVVMAWSVFYWRNPLANGMSFFRNFADVVSFRKLPVYQLRP